LKKVIKQLLPAIIIGIVSGFMFFVYEPIAMFATNIDDFWFDIHMIMKPNMMFYCLYVVIITGLYAIVYFINKHFSEKMHIYKASVLLGFTGLIIAYIQGNFLIGGLPSIDGTAINWNSYVKENIISILLIVIVCTITGFTMHKYKYTKVIKPYCFIMIAVLFMISTSLISLITGEKVLEKKKVIVTTTAENLNSASTDTNFYIFMVDAVDSTCFSRVLENSEYKDMFNDFTYYPDTMSVYRFTRDTIPFLFSDGTLNKNEKDFDTYYNESFDNSKIISELKSRGYSINIYEPNFKWNNENVETIDNVKKLERNINEKQYIKEVMKYDLFKYLPYPLKRFSHIERMDFENCKIMNDAEDYSWDDKDNYEMIKSNIIQKIDNKYFGFIHVEGAHTPFNYDENLNEIEDGTYEQKIGASITIINEFINRLKDSGVYDNSVIIVMADHGYGFADGEERQNPMLYIKGINEHHDMITSDKPVSFTDFNEIYVDLLNGKKSDELLENVDYNRKRIFLWYEYSDENHMKEYEQNGHAWEEETLIPTGREYNK